jgi:hypothetical protein
MFEEGEEVICTNISPYTDYLTIGKKYKIIKKNKRTFSDTMEYTMIIDEDIIRTFESNSIYESFFVSLNKHRRILLLKLKENICLKKVKK